MKKGLKLYGIIWLLGFIIFNVVSFAIPYEIAGIKRLEMPSFWIGYSLIVVAFVGQLACTLFFFKDDKADKVFLRLPLYETSIIALVVSIIVATVFMLIPVIPVWITAIICLIVLAYYIIAIIKAEVVGGIVSDINDKVRAEKSFLRTAVVVAEGICAEAKNDDAQKYAKQIYEALKYSDLRSHVELASIEGEINSRLETFKSAVMMLDSQKYQDEFSSLMLLIEERNKKSKLYK